VLLGLLAAGALVRLVHDALVAHMRVVALAHVRKVGVGVQHLQSVMCTGHQQPQKLQACIPNPPLAAPQDR
jgi:hypothetical protein